MHVKPYRPGHVRRAGMVIAALFVAFGSALVTPSRVAAEPVHEIGVSVGPAASEVSPDAGVLVDLRYAYALSGKSWVMFRPELLLNARRPEGQLMKGGAVGLDGLLATRLGAPARSHTMLALGAGLRGYFEPGVGVVGRAEVARYIRASSSLWLIIRGGVEAGIAHVGDDNPEDLLQVRGDLSIGIALQP